MNINWDIAIWIWQGHYSFHHWWVTLSIERKLSCGISQRQIVPRYGIFCSQDRSFRSSTNYMYLICGFNTHFEVIAGTQYLRRFGQNSFTVHLRMSASFVRNIYVIGSFLWVLCDWKWWVTSFKAFPKWRYGRVATYPDNHVRSTLPVHAEHQYGWIAYTLGSSKHPIFKLRMRSGSLATVGFHDNGVDFQIFSFSSITLPLIVAFLQMMTNFEGLDEF